MLIELAVGPARAVWSDRHGGASAPPYDTANLSTRADDDPGAVHENRARLAARIGAPPPERWWWLRQEHGRRTVVAEETPPEEALAADAVVTTRPSVPLVVLTADCAPIVIACDDAVGVVHAGWQGLLRGVVAEAVARLRELGRGDVHAALGPCIHPERYAFGRADLDRVIEVFGPEVEGRTTDGAPALDLPAAVRRALELEGVARVEDVGVCTAGSADYFSYRRDGETGRQGLVALLGS